MAKYKHTGTCTAVHVIHLPSKHNTCTSHDNIEEDRIQASGSSIANINADGTFTHVVVDDDGYGDY